MRAWRGFGMILHAEDGFRLVAQSFHGLVVEIDAIDGYIRWQRVRAHGKTVILRCDLDLAGFQIFHRLIAAAMAELELESFSTERLAENLVA